MTLVKICGLTRVQDALWAAQCGADLLGMIFAPHSPRTVSLEAGATISRAVRHETDHPLLVGVFVDQPIAHVQEAYERCGLDLVQLHGSESPAYAAALGLPYLLARRMGRPGALDGLDAYAQGTNVPWALLLDSDDPQRPGGTGRAWRWEDPVAALASGQHWILAGGLTPDTVQTAIGIAHPWGVDVSSGVEERPGIKDFRKVVAFILRAKEADGHDNSA